MTASAPRPTPPPAADGSAGIESVTTPESPEALASLMRWEEAGGTWVERTQGGSTVVDLITCDGGQVVGRLTSSRPEFVAHVRGGLNDEPNR